METASVRVLVEAQEEAWREVYLRHLEFEMTHRRNLAERVFEYAAHQGGVGSSLVAWVKRRSRAEGRAKGRAEGEVIAARSLCVDFVKQHHPGILAVVAPVIEGCPDAGRLHEWALAAPRSSDADFARLVTGHRPSAAGTSREPAASRTSRGRAPVPARRSRSSRRR